MDFYKKMGLKPLINASETYTNLGGSLMEEKTVLAMCEAARHFTDMGPLLDAVCGKAAELTRNEGAFVTSGAAASLILSAGACLCAFDESLADTLPQTGAAVKNEILVFDGEFRSLIPYWKLIACAGAKIVPVAPSAAAMLAAVNEKTAAVFLFPATVYERGIPACEEIIPLLKEKGLTVAVDAAAQLPPASNLWYYTRTLGADLAFFSGGKHIRGPQSTGLIVGKKNLTELCRKLASPNARLGRGFKTGKEELAGFITALETFVTRDEKADFQRQENQLRRVESSLVKFPGLSTRLLAQGRLGTEQPLLVVTLPEGLRGEDCNRFTRALARPVDIGVYPPEFGMSENTIFINAYNLAAGEEETVAQAVGDFLRRQRR